MRRAKYRVVYKDGKVRRTATKVATSAEVTSLGDDTCTLTLRDEGQTVFTINFILVFVCELVEFLGPEGGAPPKPVFIRPKSIL